MQDILNKFRQDLEAAQGFPLSERHFASIRNHVEWNALDAWINDKITEAKYHEIQKGLDNA